ncbi:uncharacterized protein LOC127837874 isoform X16 [Dreissena polymorpha]|uniref:uncharacterized protein LOC127837874 isoform X16 n=1 Tax=Dreissena polymorpha TaxID=45954 RepID=UPI002263FF52|nr:uncharacterized protein LOC127837874 isoform X16 [Dreissena polymorpha]
MCLTRMNGRIILLGLINLVAVSLAAESAPDVLKCAKCHKAPSMSACSDVAICNPQHEVCYVEQETDVGGETVVNAGCRRREHCDGFGCYNEETGSRQKRSLSASVTPDFFNRDIQCHHCCDGHFCNMHGCADQYDVSHLPGKRCFNCTHVQDPVHCSTAVNCEHDQDCIIEKLSFNGDIKYNLGCKKTRMCDMLDMIHHQHGARKKRDYHVMYSECCRHHMCNGWIPMLTADPPKSSDSYRCPILGYNNTWMVPVATDAPRTQTAIQTTAPLTTTTTCADLVDCSLYGHDYACSATYEPWARTNCPKFCGYCGQPTSASGGSKCQDTEDCSIYGFNYVCSDEFKEFATLKCPKFCGLCNESAVTEAPCADLDTDCASYGSNYICVDPYKDWASMHCRKFCGICSEHICKDEAQDCTVYGSDYICKGDYIPWAKLNCAKFCNLCPNVSVTTTVAMPSTSPSVIARINEAADTAEVCEDLDNDCYTYGHDYICVGEMVQWSQIHCRKNCGFCKNPVCEDADPDCDTYGTGYICTEEYRPWASIHCAKYCNLCNQEQTTKPPTTTVTTPLKTTESTTLTTQTTPVSTSVTVTNEVCADLDNDCYSYGHNYICVGDMVTWSQTNCRKTCGFCKDPVCENVDPDCDTYGVDYICQEEFKPWASIHCAKYCNLCDQANATTIMTTTPVSTTETRTTTEPIITTVAKTTTSKPEVCEDLDKDCYTYGHDYICVGEMVQWSQIHCRKNCGFCKSPVCEDADPDCDTYGTGYICIEEYRPWASIHCAKYCNLCDQETNSTTSSPSIMSTTTSTTTAPPSTSTPVVMTSTATTTEVCADLDNDCYTYGHNYICIGDMITWSQTHCRKSCGFCKNPVCENVDPDCDTYGVDYICQEEFKPWASIHCAKYCNLCNQANATTIMTTTPVSTTETRTTTVPIITTVAITTTSKPEVCEDLDKDCYTYGHDYICVGEMVQWSQIHCRKNCGFCKSPVCEDADPDCDTYGTGYICTEEYRPWASIHCAKYCNLCNQETNSTTTSPSIMSTTTSTTTAPPSTSTPVVMTSTASTTEVCADLDNDCYTYGHNYICVGDMITWSQTHCRKSCGFCKNPVCEDVDPDCDTYGAEYICTEDFKPWASIHCAKFCDLCDQNGID